MCYKILNLMGLLMLTFSASAQFHTITKEKEISYSIQENKSYMSESKEDKQTINDTLSIDSIRPIDNVDEKSSKRNTPKCDTYTSPESRYEYARARKRKPRSRVEKVSDERSQEVLNTHLPELTIPNLYAEIKKNNIKYPKIVLAQAILETGWFKSSVCRNKNNLFGLTNPRTKTYYEFDRWTESVAAYYSKVQYKYKGGNYFLWLRDIGYAEDKGYIQAVIRVLKQL